MNFGRAQQHASGYPHTNGTTKATTANNRTSQFYFQAVFHKAAVGIRTLTAGLSKTRHTSFGHLDRMYQVGFFHFSGYYPEPLGFYLYLRHTYPFFCSLCYEHSFLLLHSLLSTRLKLNILQIYFRFFLWVDIKKVEISNIFAI
jgi:hypothetical protein